MHVSVEILGGYEEAKRLLENNVQTTYVAQYGWHLELHRYDLNAVLLAYRQQKGFFEPNDVAVFLAKDKPDSVFRVFAVQDQCVDLSGYDGDVVLYQSIPFSELRHPDTIEHHKKKRAF